VSLTWHIFAHLKVLQMGCLRVLLLMLLQRKNFIHYNLISPKHNVRKMISSFDLMASRSGGGRQAGRQNPAQRDIAHKKMSQRGGTTYRQVNWPVRTVTMTEAIQQARRIVEYNTGAVAGCRFYALKSHAASQLDASKRSGSVLC
jgi:hypothetical protein